jgi:predicted ATPase/DNA-binding SARP family transcriptional activator
MVRVRCLGSVEATDGSGAVCSIDSALRRTLLSLLAIHAGQVMTADWLLEHAWDGAPPESGLRALRFHVSRLRKELHDGDLIETRPGGYRLALVPEQVDALAVEQLTNSARLQPSPRVAARMYEEALALWRGTPFADAAPCAYLDDEAARLGELHLMITEGYFKVRLDSGDATELVADLIRATTQHPLRESLWASLITAQYRAGLQADALRSYEQMRSMLADALGLDPSSELQDLQRRVLQHDLGPTQADTAGRRVRHNLPTLVTPLIDSSDRMASVIGLLQDHRLVTLTGAGGVGKTRMAVELGWSCLEQFDAGVWMVELAPVTNEDAVTGTFASALGIHPQEGFTLVDSIVDWLQGRELLVIIDNCEHVPGSVADLLNVVLPRCPSTKVLATSRQPVGVGGERVHPVALLTPESDGYDLFVERATAADNSFVRTPVDGEAIVEICRRLDGLPLAIELAAARVRSMAPHDMLTRLDDRFRLLRSGARDALARHEALWTTVEWSYQLLTEHERIIFDRLSVFTGGFDLRALEAACAGDPIEELEVVDLSRNLVDKSMVLAERHEDGTRFRLLETLREFGDDQLRTSDDYSIVRKRHLGHFVDVAEEADNLYRTEEQIFGAATFDREWDNLRTAHDWAVSSSDLTAAERLLAAARLYAISRRRWEHGDWADRTVGLATTDREASPHTYAQACMWAYQKENHVRSKELLDRGVALISDATDLTAALCIMYADPGEYARYPDPFRLMQVLALNVDLDREWWILIDLVDAADRLEPALLPDLVDQLVDTAARIGTPSVKVEAALARGRMFVVSQPPDLSAALTHYTRALETARTSGDRQLEGDCLRSIAFATVGLRRDGGAEACRSALLALYEMRFWYRIWQLFESIALELASTGHVESAGVVLGNLEAKHPAFGFEHTLGFRQRALQMIRSHAESETWMARGAAMDRHHIVEYALASL